ncbi:TRAP transporter small permease [Pseudooceanicola sp. HF7]|uniref:TRAP transporter small permease n=1 Tax=Pseudooceanicola sp. HF7 TaxID=2721560 RepID=UPI0014307427|nr:TRAP transporter small permease [Pseudooceanicola sp. HF7]NIZ09361.1 TRAP transporter small permease [Pseudooceanicola sp. HF7]
MSASLRILDAISLFLFRLACLLVLGIVLVVTYDVASRNLGLPTAVWAVNSVEYAMLYITFLCLPHLVLTRGHVCVEIVLTYLPAKLRKLWEAGLQILSAAICLYLAWHTAGAFLETLTDGSYEVRAFDMPNWAIYLSMPVGFFFGGLQFLAFFPRGQSFFGAPPEAHAGV